MTVHSKVDVVGDAQALPFCGESFDTIMCNEVLEHVPEPSQLFSEAVRVLEPGGYLLLTTPQTWGLHLEPHDYYRFTIYGLRHQAEKSGLDVIEIEPTSGLWATMASRVTDTVVHNYLSRSPKPVIIVTSVLLAPVLALGAILDKLFGKRGDTLDNILVSKKPLKNIDV
jgi:ubiquinone/menaquinone biosynthesis C-methylase UbiE